MISRSSLSFSQYLFPSILLLMALMLNGCDTGTTTVSGSDTQSLDSTTTPADSTTPDSTTTPADSTTPDSSTTPADSTPQDSTTTPTDSTPPDSSTTPTDSTPPDSTTTPTDSTPPDSTTTATDSTPPDSTTTPTDSTPPDSTTTPTDSTPPDSTTTPTDSTPPDSTTPSINHQPTANISASQDLTSGETASLDGSDSSDPDGDILSYQWVQTAGPDITLTDSSSSSLTVVAPSVAQPTQISFQLTVHDGEFSNSVSVSILISPIADNSAPSIVSRSPQADQTEVSPTAEIIVSFNEALLESSIDSQSLVVIQDSNPVPGSLSYDSSSHSLTYQPTSGFSAGVSYTVTLAQTLTDLAGNAFVGDSWSFTTGVCATAGENSSLTLSCPSGQVINEVSFASYGTPVGSCGSFSTGSCDATNSLTVVSDACKGMDSCTLEAGNATFGDPCSGTAKQLSAQVSCGMPSPPADVVKTVDLQAVVSGTSVTLSWSLTGIDPETQAVMRDSDPDPAGRIRLSYANGTTEFIDQNLTPGATYYYWIKVTDVDSSITNSQAVPVTIANEPAVPTVDGFAAQPGADGLNTTTGGGNTTALVVTTCDAMKTALEDDVTRVIHIPDNTTINCHIPDKSITVCKVACAANSVHPELTLLRHPVGTQTCTELGSSSDTTYTNTNNVSYIRVKSNKTLLGLGKNSRIVGASFVLNNTQNNIFRNFSMDDVNPGLIEAYGAFALNGASHVWIDHLSISNISDGYADMKSAKNVTLSWNHFYGAAANSCSGQHNYVMYADDSLVTYHHNFYDEAGGRNPKLNKNTKAHLYNNYWTKISFFSVMAYGGAEAKLEGNYFEDSNRPHWDYDGTGFIEANIQSNRYTGVSATGDGRDSNATVFSDITLYSYTLDDVDTLPTLLRNGSGPQ